jgi:WD40 repeat protein
VKVWRVEDNTSTSPLKQRFNLDGSATASTPTTVTRTLSGRNCLLGGLIDATFSCGASISETKAVVCSEKGDISLIDDNDGQHQLLKVAHTGFAVTCISVDASRKLIRIGGRLGSTKIMTFDELLTPSTPPSSPFEEDFNTTETLNGNLCAMSIIDGHVVTVDSRHAIKIMKDDSESGLVTPLAAHRGSVMGVRLLSKNNLNADFLSWDSVGNVLFWDLEGQCKGSFQIDLEQGGGGEEDVVNQCLVVRASAGGAFFVAGDKYGVLRILDTPNHTCSFLAKAHNSDIEDIAIYEGKTMTLVATSGRDRTVQLFKKMEDTWVLLQTMDEHTGSVTSVCFCDDGDKIISSSSDRTVQIRQIVSKEVSGQQVIAAIPIR